MRTVDEGGLAELRHFLGIVRVLGTVERDKYRVQTLPVGRRHIPLYEVEGRGGAHIPGLNTGTQ